MIKRTIIILVLIGSFTFCKNNSDKECLGTYIKVSEFDSVCLNLYEDIDTLTVKNIIRKTDKKSLLVFSGVTIENDILSRKNLMDKEIRDELARLVIFKFNVDIKRKENSTDSLTIGDRNKELQVSRYKIVNEPFYVFVDSNLNIIGLTSGYISKKEDILNFLRQ